MAVKFVGPEGHRFNGVPATDLDDEQLSEVAGNMGMTRAELVKMITKEQPKIGALYTVVEKAKGGGSAAGEGSKE